MIEDPKTRRQLAQQGRLWLMSLICAVVGTVVLVKTGSLATAIEAFIGCVLVLGAILFVYEKRRRGRPGR